MMKIKPGLFSIFLRKYTKEMVLKYFESIFHSNNSQTTKLQEYADASHAAGEQSIGQNASISMGTFRK